MTERVERVALAGALGTALVCLLGVLQRAVPLLHDVRWIDLDRERTPAALWSALLLLGAGAAWARAARSGAAPRSAGLVAALLGLMAVDEWFELHEDVGGVLYTEWQLVYAPVALVAGVACLHTLHRWGRATASALLVAGGTCWVLAQGLEAFEWWGDTDGPRVAAHYAWELVAEEALEMTGSLLLLLSPLVAVRRAASLS